MAGVRDNGHPVVVEVEGLTKRFDSFTAVDRVTFQVHEGEILALLGPNGAGKTTTVRMLASVLKPSAGTARIAGYDVVKDSRQVRQSVGLLTEFPGLYLRMTAWEYLDFFGELYRIPPRVLVERKESLLRQFELWEARHQRLETYSKGMRQKLALVRAMLHDPAVLFLDEPTSAMDPHSAKMVREAIAQLRREKRTAIICTHNLYEAETLADRIAIIDHGRIAAIGTLEELKQRFLGPPLQEVKLTHPVEEAAGIIGKYAQVLEVQDNSIRYRTSSPGTVNPQVVRELIQRGAGVIHVRELSWSLEDVYLKVVGSTE